MWSLSAVAALIIASAFFVAAEFALIAAPRSRVEPEAIHSRRARVTLTAMEDVSVMMACAQLGITVCGLVLGAVGEPAIAHLIDPLLSAIGVGAEATGAISLVVALVIVVSLHVAIGEMVPKNIALAHPERTAIALAPILRSIAVMLGPIVRGLDHMANLVVRAMGVTPRSEVAAVISSEELAGLLRESAAAGLIDPEDTELVGSALSFETARIADLAVTDAHLVTVGPHVTADDVEEACSRSGFSRFPVLAHTGTPDALAGYVHVRDTFTVPDRHKPLPPELIRTMPTIAADTLLRTALHSLQSTAAHMCRVADAEGPVGVAWLEDIIEVLVGDITDATGRRPDHQAH